MAQGNISAGLNKCVCCIANEIPRTQRSMHFAHPAGGVVQVTKFLIQRKTPHCTYLYQHGVFTQFRLSDSWNMIAPFNNRPENLNVPPMAHPLTSSETSSGTDALFARSVVSAAGDLENTGSLKPHLPAWCFQILLHILQCPPSFLLSVTSILKDFPLPVNLFSEFSTA